MAPPTRPYIGVNTDLAPATKTAGAQLRLFAGYLDAIAVAGGVPVILPPFGKDIDIDTHLERIDGVLLTGGGDMNPRRWGFPTHHAVQPVADRRDTSDHLLVHQVVKRRLPVLGIGLGMQQLNVALGGSLYLHLPDELPRALPHRDPSGAPHRHLVLLEPGSLLEEIYGGIEIRVNSNHHQALRQLGEGLRVGAKAPDGVIEGVETTSASWFCVGVQWHPESDTATMLDQQLFECFVQACARQSKALQFAA